MDEDNLIKQFTIRCGRNSVTVFVFKTLKGFRDATNYLSSRANNRRVACYMHNSVMPKVGRQGAVCIALPYLTVPNLSHEFMHLAFKMREKNTEETSVLTSSKMLAAAIQALQDDGMEIRGSNHVKV